MDKHRLIKLEATTGDEAPASVQRVAAGVTRDERATLLECSITTHLEEQVYLPSAQQILE